MFHTHHKNDNNRATKPPTINDRDADDDADIYG
jgi:hypothetical protein